MAKSTKTPEAQAQKKTPAPSTPVQTESEVNTPEALAGQVNALGGGNIETQAARLQKLQSAQQQALLRTAGRLHGNQHIQRLAATLQPGSTPEPKVKRKAQPSKPRLLVQTKLTVNEPNDQYEQEADQVAETLLKMPAPATPPPPEDGDKNSASHFSRPRLQAKGSGLPPISADLESRIQSLKGRGQPLPSSERTFFEPRMGVDLSRVRIHTGETAIQTARDLQARAYTVGSDIAFKAGEYAPGTTEGRRLLAHELTHVVQQGAASPLQRHPEGQEAPLEGVSPLDTTALQRTPEGIIQLKCAPAPASPEEDPAFQAVATKVKKTAREEKRHEPAEQKSAEAQAAAKMPETEKKGQAQHQQASQVEAAAAQQEAAASGASVPGFDEEAFVSAVEAKINAVMPQDPEKMENIESSGVMEQVESTVKQKVASGKEAAQGTVDDKIEEPPNEGAVPEKPVTPLEPGDPGAPAAPVNGAPAAPKPKSACEVEEPLQEASQSLDRQMEEAKVTDEMLEKSNEPEFQAALEAKKEAQSSVAQDPKAYRESEQQQIAGAQAEAQAEGEKTQAMHTVKTQAFGEVDALQGQQKGADEAKRAEIGQKINAIYESTKTDVTATLKQMEQDVDAAFSAGSQQAKSEAMDYIKRETKAYKDKRYEGVGGTLTEIGDFTGITKLPPEYYDIYNTGKDKFLLQMRQVLKNVAKIVGQGLAKAKQRIEKGRKEINDYVNSQPKALQELARQEANKMKGQFDKLEKEVDSKKNEIINSLADSYNKTLDSLNADIEALKEKDKGLLDKAAEMLPGPLGEIARMLVMLRDVVGDLAEQIIKDPISFVNMLTSGIGAGLNNFVNNIWTHLKKGFLAWLTGSLTGAGITLPETWDLKGIFKLVLDILGLSLSSIGGIIQEKIGFDLVGMVQQIIPVVEIYQEQGLAGLAKYGLAKLIGEDKMEGLMQLVDIGQAILSGNFGQLWEMIKAHLDDIKAMIFSKIQEFLIVQVIKSGITWLLGLLNPAGAFIKACKMIYDVVMFFIQKGSQIATLARSIIGALGAVASGNIGAIASAVEGALSNAIPVAIGFLASLIGIGDVSGKVKEIIQSVRQTVNKAIDKVLEVGPVKAVLGFVKTIADKVKAGIQKGKAWVKDKWEKGKAWVKDKVKKGKEWVKGKLSPDQDKKSKGSQADTKPGETKVSDGEVGQVITFSAGGAGHRLWVDTSGGAAVLMVASTPSPVESFLGGAIVQAFAAQSDDNKKLVGQALALASTSKIDAQKVLDALKSGEEPEKVDEMDNSVEGKEKRLVGLLTQIFNGLSAQDKLKGQVELLGNQCDALLSRIQRLRGTIDKLKPDRKKEVDYIPEGLDNLQKEIDSAKQKDLGAISNQEELELIQEDVKKWEGHIKGFEDTIERLLALDKQCDTLIQRIERVRQKINSPGEPELKKKYGHLLPELDATQLTVEGLKKKGNNDPVKLKEAEEKITKWEQELKVAGDLAGDQDQENEGSELKKFKEIVNKGLSFFDHGGKHFKGRLEQRKDMAISSKHGQYKFNHSEAAAMERAIITAAANGSGDLQPQGGGLYYIFVQRPGVGYVGGTGADNTMVRVEVTGAGVVHSHPY